ncbi:MAG TPA: hypothetical protein VNQ90_19810 [Chthoniobacteraceae bacterium]|nr:hypothetical protein [Chthoniobacteraceae bacterium]
MNSLLSSSVALACLLMASMNSAAALVAGWDFQTGTPIGATGAVQGNYTANFGNGTLWMDGTYGSSAWDAALGAQLDSTTGTAVNAGEGYSTVTTPPAALIFRQPAYAVTNGENTNGFQVVFSFSMSGLHDLDISYAYRRNSDGAYNQLTWQYSDDGETWTTFQTVTTFGASGSWNTENLSPLTALDDQANSYIRILFDGATANPSSKRDFTVDNFQFNAMPIPEPSVAWLCGLAGAAWLGLRSRSGKKRTRGIA